MTRAHRITLSGPAPKGAAITPERVEDCLERSHGATTMGSRPAPTEEEDEPRGFARSGKVKQPTRFR